MCQRKWGSAGGGSTQIAFQQAPERCDLSSLSEALGYSVWELALVHQNGQFYLINHSTSNLLAQCLVMGFFRGNLYLNQWNCWFRQDPFKLFAPPSAHLRIILLLVLDSFWVGHDQLTICKTRPPLVTVAKQCRSHYTSCSHTVKNTSQSKEETDNTPTEKTEQVTSDMKQGLRTLSF